MSVNDYDDTLDTWTPERIADVLTNDHVDGEERDYGSFRGTLLGLRVDLGYRREHCGSGSCDHHCEEFRLGVKGELYRGGFSLRYFITATTVEDLLARARRDLAQFAVPATAEAVQS